MPIRDTIHVKSAIVDGIAELSSNRDAKCSLTIGDVAVKNLCFRYESETYLVAML